MGEHGPCKVVFPMKGSFLLALVVFSCASLLLTNAPRAEWLQQGIALAVPEVGQSGPQLTPDGEGGAIVTFYGYGSGGDYDIFAQRFDGRGNVLWDLAGVDICTALYNQYDPQIVSDGEGGAIIVWYDNRSGTDYDVYAQRIDGQGQILWTEDGIQLCGAPGDQENCLAVPSSNGGVVVAWEDYRNGATADIYAQRITNDGFQWSTGDGVAVCTQSVSENLSGMAPDGSGGAVIVWSDTRTGNEDIYAQRVTGGATMYWQADGLPVCTATNSQINARVMVNDVGTAIIVWQDNRTGSTDIYAQRIDSWGGIRWDVDGVPVCTIAGPQSNPVVVFDGVDAAIIAWLDGRNSPISVYAQKLDSAGYPRWTSDGVSVCTEASQKAGIDMVPNGAQGAFLVWQDMRNGGYWDLYAQQLGDNGKALWAAEGVAVCVGASGQYNQVVESDGSGGALFAWYDIRPSGSGVYAQRIESYGHWGYPAPRIAGVRDVPGDQGGSVFLGWDASRLDTPVNSEIYQYTIWRSMPLNGSAKQLLSGALILDDLSQFPEDPTGPVVTVEQTSTGTLYWEWVKTISSMGVENYATVVPTYFDSTSVSSEYNYFRVIAHAWSGLWTSLPDSCRSLDNLAPATPQKLAGELKTSPFGLALSWARNGESDLAGYVVYRGTSADFVPDASSRLSALSDTTLFDPQWSPGSDYYYKVTARDIHENESIPATLAPDLVTAVDGPVQRYRDVLAQNVPNPFNPRTVLRFEITQDGPVSLKVYDAVGRVVRVLVDEDLQAGPHEVVWDGRDMGGRAAASGIYFARLVTPSSVQSRKMVLSR